MTVLNARTPNPCARIRATRRLLLLGCALGTSLALGTAPQRAAAQAFQATPTTDFGAVTYDRTTPGVETVEIGTPTAVISWRLSPSVGGEYLFLPAGNEATFQNTGASPDFVVLNRIAPDPAGQVPVRFDGTVIGQLFVGSGIFDPGGTILFSSPGGIIVGSTAIFDVGNLVLTSLNVATDMVGDIALDGEGRFQFDNAYPAGLGTFATNAAVATEAGSQIVASPEGSYVAFVAPRIVHGGSVRVNGSAGYIAGEEVAFAVNQGLFDIIVTTGSDNANPIVHTGISGGPASTGGTDNHQIAMVALARNQAITALLSGSVGFDAATDVTIENGAIVLSAGYGRVVGSNVDTTSAGSDASFEIGGGTFSSDLTGYAVTDAVASAATASITFAQDVSLFGGTSAGLSADAGQAVTVGGNALVSAASDASSGSAGDAFASASGGGSITISGDLAIDATGQGVYGGGIFGDGTGGTARAVADVGAIDVGGNLVVTADGEGASPSFSPSDAGSGIGGAASIEARNGGGIVVSGVTTVSADGLGGDAVYGSGAPGDGTGGTAALIADGGTILVSGADQSVWSARGIGGSSIPYYGSGSTYDVGPPGGLGSGGTVVVNAGGGGSIVISDGAMINANGIGGGAGPGLTAGVGGAGEGGDVAIDIADASVQILSLSIEATGTGGAGGDGLADGSGSPFSGGMGGAGRGGTVNVDVGAGGSLTVVNLTGAAAQPEGISVSGFGGTGGAGSNSYTGVAGEGGAGGDGTGGAIVLGASGGNIQITGAPGLFAEADGVGGVGGAGGDTYSSTGGVGGGGGDGGGGAIEIIVTGGGIETPATNLHALGNGQVGGAGGSSDIGANGATGVGGTGSGGNLRISVAGGASGSAFGPAVLNADAFGGGGSQGPADIAGRVQIEDRGTAADALTFASLSVSATGGSASAAGDAFSFISDDGPVVVSGDVDVLVLGDASFTATGSGGLQADGDVTVTTDGTIQVDHDAPTADAATVSGASVVMDAGTAILGSAQGLVEATGGNATLTAPLVDSGRVAASGNVIVTAGAITLVEATAGEDVLLEAGGDIVIGQAQAGDDFIADAGGTFTGGTVVTTGLGPDGDSLTPPDGSNIMVTAAGDLRLDTGTAPDTISLVSSAGSVLSSATLTADALLADAAVDILLNDVFVVSDLNLITTGGDIAGNSFNSDGNISLDSSGIVTLAAADSGGFITIDAVGAADLGTLTAGGNIVVDAATISLGSATAGVDIDLTADGDIAVDQAQAGDDFTATAGGAFIGGTVVTTGLGPDGDSATPPDGSNIMVDAAGDLRLDNGDAADAIRLASSGGSVAAAGLLSAGTTLDVAAPGDIAINDAEAGGTIALDAGGNLGTGSLAAGGAIIATAVGTAMIEAADSGGSIVVDAAAITLDQATAGEDVLLEAGGDIAVGQAQAGDDFTAAAGGAFTGGTVVTTGLGPDGDSATPPDGSNIMVDAAGDLRLDNGDAADAIRLASSGGSVAAAGLLSAGTTLDVAAPGDIAINDAEAGGTIALDAGGNLGTGSLAAGGAIIATAVGIAMIEAADSGGSIVVDAGGSADLGDFAADGDIDVTAADIGIATATAGGTVTLATAGNVDAGALAGAEIDVSAGGTAAIDAADSAGAIMISAGGSADLGDLAADGAIEVTAADIAVDSATAGSTLRLDTAGDIDAGALSAPEIDLIAANIALGSATTAGSIALAAVGDVVAGTLTAGGPIAADAGGAVAIDSADSGGSIALDAGGDLRLDSATATAGITLAAGGSITSASGLTAGGTLDATAGGDGTFNQVTATGVEIGVLGTARFNGAVDAETIDIGSADVELASTGSLGTARTQLVSLAAAAAGTQAIVGGPDQGPGWTLTDAEANRITAATLRITAPQNGTVAGRAPDLLVRDLSLSGQRIGTLELLTTGITEIAGAVLLSDVRADGGIRLAAGERLQIVTPAGSVRVRDAAGLPGGSLALESANVWAGSRALIDRLTADPNFDGRDDALLLNDGPIAPRGYVEAGDVSIFAGDTLFVQNSGGPGFFAGITVLADTLRITPTGTDPLSVFAFGRRINPDGSFVSNSLFFFEVAFDQGTSGYTDEAEFNRCIINTRACPAGALVGLNFPQGHEIITEPVAEEADAAAGFEGRSEMVDTSFSAEPLIEEPVTSGGDSILWDCDTDDDGDCDEEDVR